MRMKLLIDGYNVLKQITKSPYASAAERAAFINQLSRYARKKSLDILLVFDGLPANDERISTKVAITIHYAGGHHSADDYLKERLDNAHGTTLLVSSDRELVFYAQQYEIPSIDADYFYELVRTALNHPETTPHHQRAPLVKTTDNDADDLAALMDQWTRKMPTKDRPADLMQTTTHTTQSKTEKKLLQILKKL